MSFVYRNWRETMLRRVPATAAWLNDPYYDGLPYAAMGDLASFVFNGILSSTASRELLQDSVLLWSDMAESDDDDVLALLVSGALEVLTDSRQVVGVLLPLMSGRLRNLYEYTLLTNHGDDKPDWHKLDIDAAPDGDAVRRVLDVIPD